jgi:hypothetical protein
MSFNFDFFEFAETELDQAAKRISELPDIAASPQLSRLFVYLWRHRGAPEKAETIWVQSGLDEVRRKPPSKKLGQDETIREEKKPFDCRSNISTAVHDIRSAMARHYAEKKENLRIYIPPSDPGVGYQMRYFRVEETFNLTRAFWGPHLRSDRQICTIFVEQLFFHDPDKEFLIRFYDCNQERSTEALDALHKRPAPPVATKKLVPVYPFVAVGEANAAISIARWFDDFTSTNVHRIITREITGRDKTTDESSLILFGSAASNRFIEKTLKTFTDLPIKFESRTRVSIKKPITKSAIVDEEKRLKELEATGACKMNETQSRWMLDFKVKPKHFPGILTRVPNLHNARVPTTIFNSEFGTAIGTLADILTDETRLKRGAAMMGLQSDKLPEHFQMLFCTEARNDPEEDHNAKNRVKPLVWRTYKTTAF